jgi:DNA-binding MarR family transcriptional regulator
MADYKTSQRIGFSAEPLSSYQIPLFTKDRRNEYVNYGEDNNYPQYLCDLFNRSAKHNAILTAKQKWTYGKGLKVRKNENLDSMIKAQQLLSKPNQFESLNDIFKKLALDKRLYGGYALQIVWDRGGQKIAKIFHVDFSKVRSSVDNSKFFYSNNWADKKETIVEFNAFNSDRRKGLQLYYCKDYRPTLKTYPLPDYIAAVPYIEVDVEIANYHRANIQNEFFFGGILNFNNGVPTDEEQKDLVRRINRKHQGTNNAGRWIINFSDGADKAPNVIPIQPNDLDKQFDILNKTVQEELFVAHRVTSPMLLGIKTEGQLGGRTEMVDAYKLFDLNEIKPDQQHFEELFNYFAAINGARDAYEIETLDVPEPTLSEAALIQAATNDELREILGLPILDVTKTEGQKLAEEIGKLSPLVANKVLSSLSQEEIRSMIGLGGVVNAMPDESVEVNAFAKEWTKDIEIFAQFGESADDFIELSSRSVQLFEDVEIFERTLESVELELIDEGRQKFAEIEANTPEENKVLEYVKKNPISTKANIARETGLTESQVETIINSLRAASVLSLVEGAWSINNKRPSKALVDRIADEIKSLEVKYKYVGPKDSKNREFCAALLDLNKVYTRKEIDTISKRVGYNVWNKRGGWQTIKGTDIHLPFCRHTWNSVLTQKKKR